jgi:hypothetical protein
MTTIDWRERLSRAIPAPMPAPTPPAPHTRTIKRDDVLVLQALRPTAHGDRWIDESPTEKN